MFQQFNISRTGFGAYQKMLFNITNNIANANTPGYKQTRVELATLFPVVLSEAQAANSDDEMMNPYVKKKRGVELGSGVQITDITTDHTQGVIQASDRPEDMAINGRGFFQYRLSDGRVAYGRAGNLSRDVEGNIVDQSGHLLDPPIRLPEDVNEIRVDQEGRVSVLVRDDIVPQEIGQILLARFPNPEGLKNIGSNLYVETVESGEPVINSPGENGTGVVVQNAIEGSNVDVIKEMMEMIMAQKGLELLGKAMTAGTAMLRAGMSMGDK